MLAELEHDVSVSTSRDTPESEGGWAVLGLTCVFIFLLHLFRSWEESTGSPFF